MLNRLDEVIIFHALDQALLARLFERRMSLALTDAARERLATVGLDSAYGARPLRRAIQRQMTHPLALRLLAGELHDGDTIVVDAQPGTLTFQAQRAAEDARSSSQRRR